MKPTKEQAACVEGFLTGKPTRINAYAGCGKTTVLTQIAHATPRAGTYMAFNKSIAMDAKGKFPSQVECATTHGLAFRAIRAQGYAVDKLTGNLSGGYLVKVLGLTPRIIGPLELSARGYGFLLCETLRRFQRSGSPTIRAWHVPIDGKLATVDAPYLAELREEIALKAAGLWARMVDKSSTLPLGHDGYLKLWALSRPTIAGDFLLLDEAQDTNGVVMEIVRAQQQQIVCVGDRHQQIYEWRGAQNAMVELPAEVDLRLSVSFRFGQEIAAFASEVLELLGETVPLTGNPDKRSQIVPEGGMTDAQAVLCRNNATLLEQLFAMLEAGVRPHIVGGPDELLRYVDAARQLMAGRPVLTPLEFFGFANWTEVKQACESEDGGARHELERWVKVIDRYGVDVLRDKLESLPRNENAADVVLSTGHKAKGREWDRVKLASDFLQVADEPKADTPPDAHHPECRLFYVAATRGKVACEVPNSLMLKMEKIRSRIANQNTETEDADQ